MAKKRFIAIIDIDDTWEGDKHDMVCWLEAVLVPSINPKLARGSSIELEAVVYDTITDLVADNALDALAETG